MYMISQNMKKDNFAIQYQYQKCNDAVFGVYFTFDNRKKL